MEKVSSSGFTLLEMLLYIAMASLLLFFTSTFFFSILENRIKNQAIADVEDAGTFLSKTLGQKIRSADLILSPATSTSATTLSLDMPGTSLDPTLFQWQNNLATIKEATSSSISLHSTRVKVTGLQFSNVSRTSTPGIIRFQFTVSSVTTTQRSEFDYSKVFYGSASLR